MTCADVADLLDRFAAAELPAPMLLAAARHAGACPACETAVRELTGLREAVERTVEADVERLELGRVWPAVAHAADRVGARRGGGGRGPVAAGWGGGGAGAGGGRSRGCASPPIRCVRTRRSSSASTAGRRVSSSAASGKTARRS